MTESLHKIDKKQVESITWQSPSNIALVKYWGKHGNQLPQNASLSLTLKNAFTETELRFWKSDNGLSVKYFFDGMQHPTFEEKVVKYLNEIVRELLFLNGYHLEIHSRNTFPHSTGIASSASSMSALALCLVSMEEQVLGSKLDAKAFLQRASYFARLGSGSASRSLYGQWTTWGEIDSLNSSDLYASQLELKVHVDFQHMCDAVLLVSSKKKKVSSTSGHRLMNEHPFAAARFKQAKTNLSILLSAMQSGDFDTFCRLVEDEALTLHALLMTSSADGLLMKPNSLEIIEAVRDFRQQTGTKVCFTLDAGPNVHLLYPMKEKEKVNHFIQSSLLQFCENQQWIDDEMGEGPQRIH